MSLRENVRVPVDRLQQLQPPEETFKNPAQLGFIRTFVDIVRGMSREMLSTQQASPHILLQSPNGTVYRITVDDAGLIQVVNARS